MITYHCPNKSLDSKDPSNSPHYILHSIPLPYSFLRVDGIGPDPTLEGARPRPRWAEHI